MRLLTTLKERLGALAWGSLAVFLVFRSGDLANLAHRFYLGRALPPDAFGAVDPMLGAVALIGLPTTILFQIAMKSISRLQGMGRMDELRGLQRDLIRISVAGTVVSVLLVAGLHRIILERLHLDSLHYIFIMAGLLIVGWWLSLYTSLLQGLLRYRLLIIPFVAIPLVQLALSILLVTGMGWELKGALVPRVIAPSAAILLLAFLMRHTFRGPQRAYPEERHHMLRMVVPMACHMTTIAVLFHFDRLLVRNFLVDQSALYGALASVGSIPNFFMGPLAFVLFPMAAARHARGEDLNPTLNNAVAAGIVVSCLGAAGFRLFGGLIYHIWNPAFSPCAAWLWVYGLAMGLHATIEMVGNLEVARHRYRAIWIISLPTAILCAGLYLMRTWITIPDIVGALLTTRALILGGLWFYGRTAPAATTPPAP